MPSTAREVSETSSPTPLSFLTFFHFVPSKRESILCHSQPSSPEMPPPLLSEGMESHKREVTGSVRMRDDSGLLPFLVPRRFPFRNRMKPPCLWQNLLSISLCSTSATNVPHRKREMGLIVYCYFFLFLTELW
ncbi:hypothetical protein NPIL_477991 [Nephila pilipes]|uniref:Uncharacterized protein n=1 Tax=Nephila pilipes TaxID=299642 RepID=A0A8X6U6F9_NEPPI|nr:hypothetical protein NPIL_477991 [Nephila pilipes]